MPARIWVPAYVGIGSNLDDPDRQVQAAFEALAELPNTRRVCRSATVRNPALGPRPQPDFVNAVAGLLTRLSPIDLLDALLAIERGQGRDRSSGVRWGPRRIDLDLLVYGDVVQDTDRLVIPHPGIASRNFVLLPLLEIAPGLRVPGLGPVRHLAAALEQQEPQAWAIPVTSPSKVR
ncbi:MAG: 2-amino-4-hydroxy-6-hydroxymethyldihydropteridine diphosphokinase [Gammaproteobacteria bacterium]|nr:2-amino-4-hydroxy-6-hydroxymethyldihydropteridine diphosphokinase [Gammaproteobacteria bacterium]